MKSRKATSKGLIFILALLGVAIIGGFALFSGATGPSTTQTSSSQPSTTTTTTTTTPSPTPTTTPQMQVPGLPTEDVPGNDLPGVPRYEPSVRIQYQNETFGNALFTSLVYYTRASVEDVVDFFEAQMPGYNWSLIKKTTEYGGFEVPYFNMKVSNYVFLDFRRPGCTDPERCLPYVKISVGELIVGDERYTIISVDYEDYALAATTTTTTTPQETAPTSSFTTKFAEFIREILAEALNVQPPKLIKWEDDLVTFKLSKPITDISKATESIKAELVKRGIPQSIIMVETEDGKARVTVISWVLFGRTGTIVINVQANSDIIEAFFVTI